MGNWITGLPPRPLGTPPKTGGELIGLLVHLVRLVHLVHLVHLVRCVRSVH